MKPRRIILIGHVACMREKGTAYKISVRKPEGKRPFGRLRCKWEDNSKIDLRETGFGDMDWIHVTQDRVQ
jgi:hypothetical protein